MTGIVRSPDGRPVEGADVALSGPENDVRIDNGRLAANRVVGEATHVRTGIDGRYTFRLAAPRNVAVVVAHDAGFAVRTPEQTQNINRRHPDPWGPDRRRHVIGSRPAARQQVAAWTLSAGMSLGPDRLQYRNRCRGLLRDGRVTPSRMTAVYRYVTNQDNRGWTLRTRSVYRSSFQPRRAHVDVGGSGRPVIGRLALPDGVALAELILGHAELAADRPPEPRPINYPAISQRRTENSVWYTAFFKIARRLKRIWIRTGNTCQSHLRTTAHFGSKTSPLADISPRDSHSRPVVRAATALELACCSPEPRSSSPKWRAAVANGFPSTSGKSRCRSSPVMHPGDRRIGRRCWSRRRCIRQQAA